MTRRRLTSLAALAVPLTVALTSIATCASAEASNLLKNGGFETPKVGAGFKVFETGQTFPHWTVVGAAGNVGIVSKTFTQNGFSFPARAGKQWLDLTGLSQTATGVAQTVATTPGKSYLLSFSVGNVNDPGGIFGVTSTVDVLANGTQILSATNSMKPTAKKQVWKKFTVRVEANSASTTLAFINGDPSNDTNNGLDALSLE